MKYEMKPLTDAEAALLWEKLDTVFPTEEGAEEELYVFKAVKSGELIGGCVLDVDMTKIAEFNRLWVDERYRRQGLGTALVCAAEQKAKERGCRVIQNAFCFDWQNAKPLFEKMHYRQIGIFRDWPKGHEGYVLSKRLDTAQEDAAFLAGIAVVPGGEKDGAFLAEQLEAYNAAFAPRSHSYRDLDRKLVDENSRMIAGCIAGVSGWDTLHVDAIWVDEPFRNRGIGSALLGSAEREAKRIGAYLTRADAPECAATFFRKNGYAVCFAFEDEPRWTVLQKALRNQS